MHWRAYQDRYVAGIRASFAGVARTPLPRRFRRAEARLEARPKSSQRRCGGAADVVRASRSRPSFVANAAPCRATWNPSISSRRAFRSNVGPLVEISRLAAMTDGQALHWAVGDKHRLRLVEQVRGYKPGWVRHQLQELESGGDAL
jgi:hypothetical protein